MAERIETEENARALLESLAERLDEMDDILEHVQGLVGQAIRNRDELEFVVSQEIDPVFDALERIADLNAECMMFLDEYPNGCEED